MATVSPVFASFFSSWTMNFDVRRWVLPYSPWRTCHSTATTMLFCILLLTTTPVFSDFWLINSQSGGSRGSGRSSKWLPGLPGLPALPASLLPKHRLHPCEISSHGSNFLRRLELPHRLLNAHPKDLIGQLAFFRTELVGGKVAQFGGLHSIFSCAKRVANLVWIGSFAAASRIAWRASFSVTPSISNSTRPGRTTATHCSGAPLPLPMRVSCGFLVIGLSGNTRTQIFPPRAMKRVIATRAASICRSVSQQGSSAFRPKSPNDTSEPRQALPAMRPRCCFLNLTFFGINMTNNP